MQIIIQPQDALQQFLPCFTFIYSVGIRDKNNKVDSFIMKTAYEQPFERFIKSFVY